MENSDDIGCLEHDGIVQRSDQNSVTVKFSSASACSGCHADKTCNFMHNEEKTVEVKGFYDVKPGDKVMIRMKKSMGFSAIFLGYLIPLILVITMLAILSVLKVSEGLTGIGSIGILLPYYMVLYLARKNVSNKFSFTLKA
jgi:positive regulator of sigma E activity